jgi:hypothetical protein
LLRLLDFLSLKGESSFSALARKKIDLRGKHEKPSHSLSRDIGLLKEFGFKKRTIGSRDLNLKKIDKFSMRQLDRLKLILYRNELLIGSYPRGLSEKISANDLRAFAAALSVLSESFADEW